MTSYQKHESPKTHKKTNTDTSIESVYQASIKPHPIPVALESVHAGFPSVAQDYFSGDFSLDEHIIIHPNATFAVRVAGDSMIGAGIFDGDLLIVDRSLLPCDNDIVIAILDNELTVKRLRCSREQTYLHAENPAYPDFRPSEGEKLIIWGVVTGNYHWQRPDTSFQMNSAPAEQVTYPQPGAVSHQSSKNKKLNNKSNTQTANTSQYNSPSHTASPYPTTGWG